MIRFSTPLLPFLQVAGSLALAMPASAADISWSASAFDNVNQVSTAHNLIEAINANGAADVTMNTVTFTSGSKTGASLAVQGETGTSDASAFRSGEANRVITGLAAADGDALFDYFTYGAGVGSDLITLSGLTIGDQYEIQLWIVDDRAPNNNIKARTVTVSAVDGIDTDGTGRLDYTWTDATDSSHVQLITGTFTADAATQQFDISTLDSGLTTPNNVQINAYQLRTSGTVPTPLSFLSISGVAFENVNQVSTNGTLVEAINVNGSYAVTMNGVEFAIPPGAEPTGPGLAIQNEVGDFADTIFRSGEANRVITGLTELEYDSDDLFDYYAYGSGINSDQVTLSGLAVGQTYEVQLFIVDDRATGNLPTRTVTVSGVDGIDTDGTGRLDHTWTDAADSSRVQLITGIFTAAAATQYFDISCLDDASTTPNNTQLNAYQIRAVPTPSKIVITGTSLTGTVFTITFTGEAGVSDWRVKGSTDLPSSFPDDLTGSSTITEGNPGEYTAEVELGSLSTRYFLRIER